MLAEDANAVTDRARAIFPEYLRATYHNGGELTAKVVQAIDRPGLRLADLTYSINPHLLYFVDPGVNSEQVLELKKTLKRSRVFQYSAPVGGMSGTPTMQSEIHQIADAAAVVGLLLPHDYRSQDIINARSSFLLGVAVALGRPVLALLQEPIVEGPADMRLLTQQFGTVASMRSIAETWLATAAGRKSPARPISQASVLSVDLGNAWAERDPSLHDYFLETAQFRRARDASVTVFLGRRGTGKSAIALTLEREAAVKRGMAIRLVRPEEFEMKELQDAYQAVMSSPTRHWQLILGATWRYLLLAELAQTYIDYFSSSVTGQPAQLQDLRAFVQRIPHQDDFVDGVIAVTRFIRDADTGTVREFMASMSRKSLYKPFNALSRQVPARVVLDNLDVSWDTSHQYNRFVLASLIRESEKLNQQFEQRAAVLLFLRSDIYNIVKLADPDIDKQSRERMVWDARSLMDIVGLRLKHLLNVTSGTTTDAWYSVFPATVEGQASHDFMLTRTLFRPRELIKLCAGAIEIAQAHKAKRVSESDILAALQPYSEAFLTDLHGEYLIELPDLYYFMLEFAQQSWPKGMDEFRALVRSAARNEGIAHRDHAWHGDAGTTDSVIEKLYEIGVLGLAKRRGKEVDVVLSYQRDWHSAWAASRRRVSRRYGRGAVKAAWEEPLVMLHPGLWPALGAFTSDHRGAYITVATEEQKVPPH